jgi:ABC-2 type transport system ATP-binding protein
MTTGQAAIDVRELVRDYPDVRAVDGLSFRVETGEVFGFLGPNGAGKTTTIRILATLVRPTSGSARVAGYDIVAEAAAIRREVGFAMQSVALDDLSTGRENLELVGRLRRIPSRQLKRRIDELLELMGLTAAAGRLAGTYSGGMRRRLDLATALVHEPRVLFLDEPTEGLDPQSRLTLWEEFRRINEQGTTLFLTTHYMDEADQLCGRVAIVDAGRIVAQGEPAALKRGLGADIVRLALDAPDPAGLERQRVAAEARLAGFGPVMGMAASPDGLTIRVADSGAAIPALIRRLDGDGTRIAAIAASRPTLDDVFLHHTGRRIRPEEADRPMALGWWA